MIGGSPRAGCALHVMAGFQVSIDGRFWVSTEGIVAYQQGARRGAAMSGTNSHVGELILARLDELLERVSRMEPKLADVADAVDELDRFNRPFGDGTRLPRSRRAR